MAIFPFERKCKLCKLLVLCILPSASLKVTLGKERNSYNGHFAIGHNGLLLLIPSLAQDQMGILHH